MALVNEHFLKLPGSYLFSDIAKKVNTFKITHPKQDIIRLGIGDVTQPLPQACFFFQYSGTSAHNVAVYIYRIDRVCDRDMTF